MLAYLVYDQPHPAVAPQIQQVLDTDSTAIPPHACRSSRSYHVHFNGMMPARVTAIQIAACVYQCPTKYMGAM